MTDATNTEPTDDATEQVTYEKGSWQESLDKSSTLLDRSTKARKTASNLLWKGAQSGITEWLPGSDDDISGEGFYNEVLTILGKSRKGDASKIKTVAVAVRVHGLDLTAYPNLSKAYAEATRLTKTVQAQVQEDDAAERAIEAIEPPKTTSSVEGAAAILLSKGVDGAVVAILDALGATNEAAHRSFMRAVSVEVAARVQAAKPPKTPKAGPKAGATQATGTPAKPKTAVKAAAGKTKGKPVKAAAVKPAPAVAAEDSDKGEPVEEPVAAGNETADDLFPDDLMDDAPDTEDDGEPEVEPATPAVPVKKAAGRPVVRRPGRKA